MSKLLRSLTFLLLMAAFAQLAAAQTVINAASCNSSDVQSALNAISADNTIVNIPAGNCTWSTPVIYNQVYSMTIQGATTCTDSLPTTCNDNTVIQDNVNHGGGDPNDLGITTRLGSSLRITGLSFVYSSLNTTQTYHGALGVSGTSQAVRLDHLHFSNIKVTAVDLEGWVYGVMDHSLIDAPVGSVYNGIKINHGGWNGETTNWGDASWADYSYFGTEKFFFVEDSTFNNGAANDCTTGGRFVFRHNLFNATAPPPVLQTHPTGGGGNNLRGCRAQEVYDNNFVAATGSYLNNAIWISSGTALVWGNSTNAASGGTGFKTLIRGLEMRSDNSTYSQTFTTTGGWGFCGPTPAAGVVNLSGTSVTLVSGTPFDTSWTTGQMIVIAGQSCGRTSLNCRISSVNSGTSLTLQGNSNQTLTAVAYAVGSAWDGNSDASGYPCIDQFGRGKGDLLAGVKVPLNTLTGTVAWPHQQLEPVYEWANHYTPVPSNPSSVFSNQTTSHIVLDRDIYMGDTNNCPTNCSKPITFNGTSGVGQGLLSARPTTCTPLVAYWATDTNTLYQCSAVNTWSTYYTPYKYPHPLTAGGGGARSAPFPPSLLQVVVN